MSAAAAGLAMEGQEAMRIGDIVGFIQRPQPQPEVVFEGPWYVLLAHERTEYFVMRSALVAGLDAWYPQRCYWSKITRKHRVPWKMMEPLYPGYVFVRAPQGRSIVDTVKVMREVVERRRGDDVEVVQTGLPIAIGLMRARECLFAVPEIVIDRDRLRESRGEFDDTRGTTTGNPQGYKAGETVGIAQGPFATFGAEIIEILEDVGRAWVEVTIFGRRSRMTMPLDDLCRSV